MIIAVVVTHLECSICFRAVAFAVMTVVLMFILSEHEELTLELGKKVQLSDKRSGTPHPLCTKPYA